MAEPRDTKSGPVGSQKLVFIPAMGSLGDVYPYMALALRLVKSGVRVRLGTHLRYKEIASRPEYEWVEIGGDLEHTLATTPEGQQMQKNPSVFNMGLIKKVFYPLMAHWFCDILKNCAGADMIVLGIVSLLAGFSAFDKFPQLKGLLLYLYPTSPTNEYAPPVLSGSSTSWFNWINSLKWSLADRGAWSLWQDEINKYRAQEGLAPVKEGFRDYMAKQRNPHILSLTAYSTQLVPRPKDWGPYDDQIPPMFSEPEQRDFEPSKELLEFLSETKSKPIFIGVGSMMGSMLHKHEQTKVVHEWIAGLKAAQVRGIISLSGLEDDQKALFKSDDSIFFVNSFIPHHWLFPKLAGVVHHGGAGTLHTGLLHGLPTLVLPFGADQPFNGDRIHINKLGPEPIPIRSVTASKFASAVKHMIHDQHMIANAKRVSGILQQEDGVGTAANVVLDILADKNVTAPVTILMKN